MRLSARGLKVTRGERVVLDGLSLDLVDEVVMLVGPNGVGKSTLLDALCGVLPLAAGSVLLDGRDVHKMALSERAAALAFVPQRERHAFAYRICDLVAMGRLGQSGGFFATAEDKRIVAECIARLGLADLAERSILEVSGGELQLALIARALAQQAPLLLMDEPTSSLDLARHEVLSGVVESHSGPVLAATHDINWALALADRMVCLKDGRVLWHGPPQESQAPLEEAFSVRLSWFDTHEGPRAAPRR